MIYGVPIEFIERIAIALAIGALLGMEREYTKKQAVVGVRTFALVSLLGTLFVLFAELTGEKLQILLGFVAVLLLVAILYASNLFKYQSVGMTTSIALLLSYVLGVFVAYGHVTESIFITIAVAIVMFAKDMLHGFIDKLTNTEVLDFLEFLALIGIVYPLIPEAPLALYGITINIMNIWILLILLALINFAGFLGARYIGSGPRRLGFMSLLGGLVSSTAVLYSMTQAYAKAKNKETILAASYLFINASMFLRNLAILAVMLPLVAQKLMIPTIIGSATLMAGGIWLTRNKETEVKVEMESPFQISKAIPLVLKLAVVIIALSAITTYLPDIFYLAAFMGGLVSSASVMASLPTLLSTGEIDIITAGIGASITLLGEVVIGNMLMYYIAGEIGSAKRALPFAVLAAVVYAGLFLFIP